MIKFILKQFKNRIPVISILFTASCIISTIPQFFSNPIYSEACSKIYGIDNFEYFTLAYFTHSPNILIPHLIGNILIFLSFGILVEVIIGSNKIALFYISSFIFTTTINTLHSTTKTAGHGASGI